MEFKVKHSHYWGDVLVATLISTLTIDFNSEYIVQDTFTNENNPRSFGGTAYTLDGAIDILN